MKKVLILLVCFMFIGIINSFAEELPSQPWELGTEVYYFRYKEPGVMQEKGIMYGLTGSYRYQDMFSGFILKAEGRTAMGTVDYKNSGTINDITDYVLEFRGLVGYDFSKSEDTILAPYFGVGYRYLNDDTSGRSSSTGALGYERESNYFYSPVGLEAVFMIEKEWSIAPTLEYDIFWRGLQKSHLSDANSSFNDLENKQKKGYGLRGSVKLIKQGEKLDFIIEPFIRYWHIAKSKDKNVSFSGVIVGTGYEPKNNTIEGGIKLGVQF